MIDHQIYMCLDSLEILKSLFQSLMGSVGRVNFWYKWKENEKWTDRQTNMSDEGSRRHND